MIQKRFGAASFLDGELGMLVPFGVGGADFRLAPAKGAPHSR